MDQLKENNSGNTMPNDNLAKMLDDAERMVNEMEKRNFTPQKTAADKEREEAKKRMILLYLLKTSQRSYLKTFSKTCIFPFLNFSCSVSSAGLHQS